MGNPSSACLLSIIEDTSTWKLSESLTCYFPETFTAYQTTTILLPWPPDPTTSRVNLAVFEFISRTSYSDRRPGPRGALASKLNLKLKQPGPR